MQRLETERLVLRDWSINDARDLYEYAKSPNVGPNAGWKPHDNIEESLGIIQMFINEQQTWAIEDKHSYHVIGSVGLHKDPLRTNPGARMLGYVLSEEFWGRGIIPEAVAELIRYAFSQEDVTILSIQHYDFNPRSGRVAEKLGFKKEGCLESARKLYDGRICSLVSYSLRREDYYLSTLSMRG